MSSQQTPKGAVVGSRQKSTAQITEEYERSMRNRALREEQQQARRAEQEAARERNVGIREEHSRNEKGQQSRGGDRGGRH